MSRKLGDLAALVVGVAFLAATAGLGAGCAGPTGADVRADLGAGRTAGTALADVPFVSPEAGAEDRGAAALAAVLTHAGRTAGREDLERELVRPGVGGSFPFDVALAVSRRNLHPWARRGLALDDLRAWVEAGRPPVVLLEGPPADRGRRVFAVVTGFDDGRGLVLLHDGAEAHAPHDRDAFLERWERNGRFALVAVPPEAPLPSGFALLSARDRASLGYLAERAGDLAAAHAHYEAAAALDPRFRTNLGRLLLLVGRHSEAENELRGALAVAPHDVRARNNLAVLLLEQAAGLGPGPARDAKVAEAISHAEAAVRFAPAELLPICRDTLERALAARDVAP